MEDAFFIKANRGGYNKSKCENAKADRSGNGASTTESNKKYSDLLAHSLVNGIYQSR